MSEIKLFEMPMRNMADVKGIMQYVAASNLVSNDLRNNPEDCFLAIQYGRELGLGYASSLREINVIKGQVSLSAKLMLGLAKKHPKYAGISETIAGEGDNMVATCVIKRKDDNAVTCKFSVSMARAAGLWGKGAWKTYPHLMLKYRARTTALGDCFADAFSGFISIEEARDYPDIDPPKGAPIKNITPIPPENDEPLEKLIATEKIEKKAQQERTWGTDEQQLEQIAPAYDKMESQYPQASVDVKKAMPDVPDALEPELTYEPTQNRKAIETLDWEDLKMFVQNCPSKIDAYLKNAHGRFLLSLDQVKELRDLAAEKTNEY